MQPLLLGREWGYCKASGLGTSTVWGAQSDRSPIRRQAGWSDHRYGCEVMVRYRSQDQQTSKHKRAASRVLMLSAILVDRSW